MTGLRFLFRVTLRRLDLAAEMYHLRAPQKIPLVISTDEAKRLLAVADNLKARVMLSLSYGCGLRAGEVVRLKVKHIDSAQSAKAIDAGQMSAATAAVKEIGVLSGIRIERSERGAPGEFDWIEKLSVDELRLLADGKLDIASFRKDEDAGRSRPN
jgi:integrase/recombinase XerD